MLDVKAIHKKSAHHKQAVLKSKLCGCFHCLRIYPPSDIKEWVARDADQTAICPHCRIDAVLPSSEVDLSAELLEAMRRHWFTPEYCAPTVTFDEANSAKSVLEERLGHPPWLHGIEISEDTKGLHFMRVTVTVTKERIKVWNVMPQTIAGVRVIVDEVGAEAFTPKRFFDQLQAGYAQMTPQERLEDAQEMALWEGCGLPLKPPLNGA